MISINTGYNIQTRDPIDSRMILSKSEMKEVSDGIIAGTTKTFPENFFCVCKDDALIYAFNKAYKDSDIGRYKQTPEPVRKIVYGFKITDQIYDPAASVEYLSDCDNAGYTPAAMNFETDTFSYGSWKEDEFFMPRPCMLKYDGTVDYYLDPNDYTKKENGEASDVTNVNYDGNAMMEWGRDGNQIWLKVSPDVSDSNSANVYISNAKIDGDFKAFSFIAPDGVTLKQHFYTPIYNGIIDSNGRLRSMSTGGKPKEYQTALEQINAAKKNGNGWNIETFGDRCLISFLLMMLAKSKSPNTVFGLGDCGRSSASSSVSIGTMNTKGLFWGKNTTSSSSPFGVKVFGMENYWGCVWRRVLGLVNDNGTIKYKMCYGKEDGSSVLNYDFTGSSDCGSGFVDSAVVFSGSSAYNYIKSERYSSNGTIIPTEVFTTANTGYRSYLYFEKSGVNIAIFGGFYVDPSARNGLFCTSLVSRYSESGRALGACVSYR